MTYQLDVVSNTINEMLINESKHGVSIFMLSKCSNWHACKIVTSKNKSNIKLK